MSNQNQQTSKSNAGKGQHPAKPDLPEPGKNPDFPDPGEPIGPDGTTTTPTTMPTP